MALLNGYSIFVNSEQLSRGVEVSEHPVEKGFDITDNIKANPKSMSISGKIVGKNASSTLSKIETLHKLGKFVTYVGRNSMSNAIIVDFNTDHPSTIAGGCAFDLTLKEVRIAQSPYVKKGNYKTNNKTKGGSQQVTPNKKGKVYHTVKKGETAGSIAGKYKSYGCTVSFIMKNNPNAPVKKGNWTTLPINAKLWVYTKK